MLKPLTYAVLATALPGPMPDNAQNEGEAEHEVCRHGRGPFESELGMEPTRPEQAEHDDLVRTREHFTVRLIALAAGLPTFDAWTAESRPPEV